MERLSVDEEPLTSVVLPILNGARWLREALAGVLGQEGCGPVEVVAVDDGSTDGSADLVRSLGDPRIRLRCRENRGIAVTRNEAIRSSRGRFIAFIDQDDLWRPGKLARQLPLFAESPRVGLVHCRCARVDGDSRVLSGGPLTPAGRLAGDVRRGMLLGNVVPGTAGVVVRRECFHESGLFDEELNGSDDWDMWARIAARYEFRYIAEPLAATRLHAANTSTDVERMRADSLRVQRKLLSDPLLTAGLSPRHLARIERKGRARIHAYCAAWLIRTGRIRAASGDLGRALRYDPAKPRHLLLLLFTLAGWVPRRLRDRLV